MTKSLYICIAFLALLGLAHKYWLTEDNGYQERFISYKD